MFCLLLIPACVKHNDVNHEIIAVNNIEDEDTASVVIIDLLRVRADEIALSLDEGLLAAQLLICGIDGRGRLPPHMVGLLTECPPGGVMLFRYNLNTDNDSIRALLTETVSLINDKSGIPPFLAVDHEGGVVNRFPPGTASLPGALSYWELSQKEGRQEALSKVEADSFSAGLEINRLGINMNFAPVAEYLTGDNSEFLKSRSYGPDPVFTADAAAAFVRGMERADVLCVIKHFPGSAGPDPHYSASALNGDRAALDALVSPFAALIENGARAVMAAHTSVPAIDSEISSLSPAVMGNWLKGDLGFSGIIISDDFSMAAAGGASPEEAAIRSIAAGADMVLVWPPEIRRTHRAFVSALEDGRLSRERAQDAAARIIYEKLRMGLIIHDGGQ
jgi:beta-N-acetylhexosaminidase